MRVLFDGISRLNVVGGCENGVTKLEVGVPSPDDGNHRATSYFASSKDRVPNP